MILVSVIYLFGVGASASEECITRYHKGSSVRLVYTYTPRGDVRQSKTGTGFFISREGHVLTAEHVVRPDVRGVEIVNETVTAFVGDNPKPLPINIAKRDVHNDLALLKMEPAAPFVAVPLGLTDRIASGSRLLGSIGAANGSLSFVNGGVVREITHLDGIATDVWRTSMGFNYGDSGGPVFGPDGNVVGVADAKRANDDAFSFVIPISAISEMIREQHAVDIAPDAEGPCSETSPIVSTRAAPTHWGQIAISVENRYDQEITAKEAYLVVKQAGGAPANKLPIRVFAGLASVYQACSADGPFNPAIAEAHRVKELSLFLDAEPMLVPLFKPTAQDCENQRVIMQMREDGSINTASCHVEVHFLAKDKVKKTGGFDTSCAHLPVLFKIAEACH